jgi:hypothetical protein
MCVNVAHCQNVQLRAALPTDFLPLGLLNARCTCEIKSNIAMAKVVFNKKTLFTNKLDLNLLNKLVKCYIWSTALYGDETWTLQKDQK